MKRIFAAAILTLLAAHIFATAEGRSDYAYIKSAEASSTYSEWLSGRKIIYDALNAFDDKLDTVWVDEIRIINGFAHKDLYKKNNRVKTLNIACIHTDVGPAADYTLEDDCEDFQSIHLKETATVDALVFTIQDVYRGTKYNDTCISDMAATAAAPEEGPDI